LTKQIEETKLAQEKQVKDNTLNEHIKSSNVKDARAIKEAVKMVMDKNKGFESKKRRSTIYENWN